MTQDEDSSPRASISVNGKDVRHHGRIWIAFSVFCVASAIYSTRYQINAMLCRSFGPCASMDEEEYKVWKCKHVSKYEPYCIQNFYAADPMTQREEELQKMPASERLQLLEDERAKRQGK